MEMRKQIFRVKGSEIIKIKDKLKKWLLADELLKIQDIESKYNELKDSVARAEDLLHKAYGNYLKAESVAENTVKLADDCRKLMNDICDVGVDVARDKYHSWAVVCIHGKMDAKKRYGLVSCGFLKNGIYVADQKKSYYWFKDVIESKGERVERRKL